MAYKYIIIKINGEETPVIFPDKCFHDKIAGMIKNEGVVSAGYVNFIHNGSVCYGKSKGLNLISREEEDAKVINKFM